MTIDTRASGNDLELWHVQLGGAVRTMTLDELDRAFQSGVIDERTMVLKAGALRWTTLGELAGLESQAPPPPQAGSLGAAVRVVDEQPNSIAPMATDIASSNLVLPPPPAPRFDVSFGTEELRVFRPKRRVGRALGAIAAVAVVASTLFGVKSYGTDKLEAKLASVSSLLKKNGENARSAAGAAAPTADPASAPASSPPATPVEELPSAKPGDAGVSIDSLPPAPPVTEKADRKHRKGSEHAPKRKTAPRKASAKASSDPTRRGSGPFDPLDGKL